MSLSSEQRQVLESIRHEWGRAERDIKLAEQVCNEIVFPSINELRYGGRRVVDAVHGLLTGAPATEVDALFADARFDCHRARHDAVDTATSKIAITIDIMVDKLTYEAILPAYPDFVTLVRSLADVREKISISRKDRENREAIYSAIEAADFPVLVKQYQELRASESIIRRLAKRNRWRDVWGFWGFVVGAVGAVLSIIGIYLIYHPPEPMPPSVTSVTTPVAPSAPAASLPSAGSDASLPR